MLAVSRLYSFLDHKNGFNVNFLEGQKFIHDLVLLHPIKGSGFEYFRETVLGLMPMIFFLKPGESLGLYLDSEEPYFRFKIETNSGGHTRTLLIPEDFNSFPMKIRGQVRVSKIFANNSIPYTSMLELDNVASREVINKILSESYQTDSEVIVAEMADQSIMVTRLPPMNSKKIHNETPARKDYIKKQGNFFHDVFETATDDLEKIVKMFEDRGLAYLGSRQISFFCPCSHERMALNLKGLYSGDQKELFEENGEVEIKCDYCRKVYIIKESELNQ
jgi:molecular chaperone Hsp33